MPAARRPQARAAAQKRSLRLKRPAAKTKVDKRATIRSAVSAVARPGRKRAAAPAETSVHADAGRKSTLSWNRQEVECSICCADEEAGKAVKLACSHGWYCRGCVDRYAQARLAEGAVDVSCPDCRAPIPDHDLKSILNQDVINRFHERSISRAVASSSNLFTCPTPGCDMCYEIEDGDYHLRNCPKCNKGSCLRCGVNPYHTGLNCAQYMAKLANSKKASEREDKGFLRWMHRTGTKQCPQCKMAISKEDLASQNTQRKECHKMMCRGCSTKFCFKCLAILTDNYNCGCSIERHGFLNPFTGRRNEHLKPSARREKARR